ncbi:nardilysin [Achlya hypogyna]|uniref:Nardilysin n=1 Tax=Achlya hypogyna TaxID=1202772 RepID=A0A1V9YCN4_ACHHY|nr:nardilysin [Achlya hypogyna]
MPGSINDTKSPNDPKNYRMFTLPNGLEVLLMQNVTGVDEDDECDDEHDDGASGSEEEDFEDGDDGEEEDEEGSDDEDDAMSDGEAAREGPAPRKAGACLTVGVGSFSEPAHLQGLAHYLEHMLFMGSEKYPDENEFEAFLSAHGGYSNGETDVERTSYMFEVGPKHLAPALDMFAQFFVAPLMKADALDRELSAIESEFARASQDDSIRFEQVLCDLAVPGHPFQRFNWGNTKSLKSLPEAQGIDVRAEILRFYETHYSANLMKLVVCGEEELDVLEGFVRESFGAVPNRDLPSRDFSQLPPPFEGSALVQILPLKETHVLNLHWPLPPLVGHHALKPADFVASILGHESEGSILFLLKERGWASTISAGLTDTHGYDYGTFGAVFTLEIKLTLEGLAQYEAVVLVVFQFLRMMADGPLPAWIFDELKAMSAVNFQFQEERDAIEQCEELAALMQDMFAVAPCDLLSYDVLKGDFDAARVQALVLDHLTTARLRVHVASSTFAPDASWTCEPWFNVPYKVAPIPGPLLLQWQTAAPIAALRYQSPNPFIPRDLALIDVAEPLAAPRAIATLPSLTAYYLPDTEFKTPRAFVMLHCSLPALAGRPAAIVLADVYLRMVKDALNAYAYQAQEAQLSYVLHVKEGAGFELQIGGFHDKLLELVHVVTTTLASFTLGGARLVEARFDVIKEELLRTYKNALFKPQAQAKYLRLQLLEETAVPLPQLLAALEALSFAELVANAVESRALWAGGHLTAFVHGNVSEAAALALSMAVADRFAFGPPAPAPTKRIHQLPAAGLTLREASDNAAEVNSVVEWYYQFGNHTVATLALADLLEQMMQEPLFDTLRTKQQLGYEVSCTVRVTHGVLGFGLKVVSASTPTAAIDTAIAAFVADFATTLATMDDAVFDDHVRAQIQAKEEPDVHLYAATSRHWTEIQSKRLAFDIDAQLVGWLKSPACTRDAVAATYRRWFATPQLKVVVVGQQSSSVVAQRETPAAADDVSGDALYARKAALPTFQERHDIPSQ